MSSFISAPVDWVKSHDFGYVVLLLPILGLARCESGKTAEPTIGAQREAARWTAAKFGGVEQSPPTAAPSRHPLTTELPFSFTYAGKSFRDLDEPYAYRSFYLPSFGMGALTPENTGAQQKACAECRRLAPLMLEGDHYPLTPYSLALDRWIAWQFNRPEQGDGVVQAFRRVESVYEAARFRLRGLDPGAMYVLTNLDTAQSQTLSGRELLDRGLAVAITDQPGSAVITYQRKRQRGQHKNLSRGG
jgi:hypothetical protein